MLYEDTENVQDIFDLELRGDSKYPKPSLLGIKANRMDKVHRQAALHGVSSPSVSLAATGRSGGKCSAPGLWM